MIKSVGRLIGSIKVGTIIEPAEVKEHYLEGTHLIIVLTNNQKLSIDISSYIGVITDSKATAIENMTISIQNQELILDYDENILDFNFNIEDKDLIVDNNETLVDFNINENKELEVSYNGD